MLRHEFTKRPFDMQTFVEQHVRKTAVTTHKIRTQMECRHYLRDIPMKCGFHCFVFRLSKVWRCNTSKWDLHIEFPHNVIPPLIVVGLYDDYQDEALTRVLEDNTRYIHDSGEIE